MEEKQASAGIRWSILSLSALTVMAGAAIAPALPALRDHFSQEPGIELLSRLSLSLPALFMGLFGLPSGLLAQRWGHRPLLMASLLLYGLSGGAGSWLEGIYGLLLSRALLGIASAALITSSTLLIGALFEGQARERFLGLQAAFMGFGGVLFLSLGGWLSSIHWRCSFLPYLFSLLLLPLLWSSLPSSGLKPEPREKMEEGRSEPCGGIFLAAFLGSLAFYVLPTQLPFYLRELGDPDPRSAGYLLALMTLLASFVSLGFVQILSRIPAAPLRRLTYLLLALGVGGLGLVSGLWGVGLVVALMGLGMGLFLPLLMEALLSKSSPAQRARRAGWLTTSMFLGQFASPLLSEPLAEIQGSPTMFLLVASAPLSLMILPRT